MVKKCQSCKKGIKENEQFCFECRKKGQEVSKKFNKAFQNVFNNYKI